VFSWHNAPVLDLGGRPHAPARESVSLLIAAWAYPVHGTWRRKRPTNLFQDTTLRLIGAGLGSISEVADHLGLDRTLAGLIVRQLAENNLIGSIENSSKRLSLTTKGEEAILAGVATEDAPAALYVYQDAETGVLLMGSSRRLEEARASPSGRQRFIIELGTKGRPERRQARAVLPTRVEEPRDPEFGSIVRALQRGRARNSEQFVPTSLIPNPTPVLIHTYAYTTAPADGSGWYVADPFTRDCSPWLRAQLEQRVGGDPALKDCLEPVIEDAGDAVRQAEAVSEQRNRVHQQVLARLPSDAARLAELIDVLITIEMRRRHGMDEFDLPSSGLSRDDVVCALLRDWARRHPTDNLAETLPHRDEKARSTMLEQVGQRLGVPSLPPALREVDHAQLRAACQQHDGPVEALLLAALLAANRDLDHPLRRACHADAEIIEKILIETPRNTGSLDEVYALLGVLTDTEVSSIAT
jgi:DNA-binding MarR family transcriptional regulator